MTSTPVRCWAPLRFALVTLTLTLPSSQKPCSPINPHVWRFYMTESYHSNIRASTHILGTGDCKPEGCQQQVSILIPPNTFKSITRWSTDPAVCSPHNQIHDDCHQWEDTYGGRPYTSCYINTVNQKSGFFFGNGKGQYTFRIKDPWHQRWASGVKGKLYPWALSSKPVATLYIYRAYIRVVPPQLQQLRDMSQTILQQEQAIKTQLQPAGQIKSSDPPTPFTWLKTIQEAASLLNISGFPNITDCFLCASLQRPLLAAVPLTQFAPSNNSGQCPSPIAKIPLYLPPPNLTLPICYGGSNQSLCNTTRPLSSTLQAPSGTFFWCNKTLTKCINTSSPTPCIPT
uniref:Uncharacterized protein n=1 Tax=Rhinolophus ferrumequinum TaxID=59479 RepID=A0A671E653_RHIFE